MSYRGGRGRGGYGQSSVRFAKEEAFEIFPEIKEYPDVKLKEKEEYWKLIQWGKNLQKFWNSSPYHLGSCGLDSERNGGMRKSSLSDYMNMTGDYVPAELVSKNVRRSNKKVRWDPQSDLQRLDFFEKLDQGPLGQDDGEKEKKEDEEEEDEDSENMEDEEVDSGDDYDQNIDFDDDEDDFNMNDDIGDDDGFY